MNPHLALAAECSSSAMRSLLACFFGCALCACSMLSPDAVAQRIPGQPPTNYRKIIADGSIPSKRIGAEVSMLRQTRGPQPGDWMACVMTSESGHMTYTAIFFENEKIIDYRTAISYDRCEGQSYEALPPKSPPPTKDEADQPKEKK